MLPKQYWPTAKTGPKSPKWELSYRGTFARRLLIIFAGSWLVEVSSIKSKSYEYVGRLFYDKGYCKEIKLRKKSWTVRCNKLIPFAKHLGTYCTDCHGKREEHDSFSKVKVTWKNQEYSLNTKNALQAVIKARKHMQDKKSGMAPKNETSFVYCKSLQFLKGFREKTKSDKAEIF